MLFRRPAALQMQDVQVPESESLMQKALNRYFSEPFIMWF